MSRRLRKKNRHHKYQRKKNKAHRLANNDLSLSDTSETST